MSVCDEIRQKPRAICVVTGHYGSGKSTFSVGLAEILKARLIETGRQDFPVRLADLDIVNPYFRSADSRRILENQGIEVIVQQFANTNVDIPSIPGELNRVFEMDAYSVLDIGGDDSGAAVLGGLSEKIKRYGFLHFHVVNFKRPMTETPEDALRVLQDVERMAKLPVTHLVNNTNLGEMTERETMEASFARMDALSRLSGIEAVLHTGIYDTTSGGHDHEVMLLRNSTKKYF